MKQITMVIILLAMIPLIASIVITSTLPISQAAPSMDCTGGSVLLQNPVNGATFCETQSKASKFIERGFIDVLGVMPEIQKSSQPCKTGYVIVQNPNTGSITCEKPYTASKFIAKGSVALIHIDIEEDTPIGSITDDAAHAPTAKLISIDKYESKSYSNADITYTITFELIAGDTNLKDIQINVRSDVDNFGFSVSSLNADSSSVNVIRVHAMDPDSITGEIIGYSLN